MIWFDQTKAAQAGHRSGLTRVSTRLREELGAAATGVAWGSWNRAAKAGDWFLTAELFCEAERPEFWAFLRQPPCRLAAIFHDAIPLKHPAITWPQSVSRHPEYMKMLASFDRVFAVSEASRDELEGFWRWQGIRAKASVEVIALGADAGAAPRRAVPVVPVRPALLCVGIIEPRKNQAFLLEVCESLWLDGLEFDLHLVGRVNPRFGRPIEAQIRRQARRRRGLHFHGTAEDARVAELYAGASALAFPTRAEGCGLPLLEALWLGVPCVCSDLPVLRENAAGGGCRAVPLGDVAAWRVALRELLFDSALRAGLAREACDRSLPTWSAAAAFLRSSLAA
jgi:glycosyltransferase involved in cell wall biosynthesis